jgi:hypothetical protein
MGNSDVSSAVFGVLGFAVIFLLHDLSLRVQLFMPLYLANMTMRSMRKYMLA